jgi:hypothetical protein
MNIRNEPDNAGTDGLIVQRPVTVSDRHVEGLADVLIDCVDGGASVSFMHPLPRARALEFGSKRGFRFPQWQRDLVEEPDIRASFEAVLNRLAAVGPWSRYRFFVQSSPELDGRTPVEALRAGGGEAVLHAAESWAHGEQGGV